MSKIGFIIINYNDAETTKILLDNIKSYKCIDKIVVVDNASTDTSYEQLLSYQSKRVIILKSDKNLGYGAGINLGIHYLESLNIKHTFVSNSDVIIYRENDLQKIIDSKNEASIIIPIIKEQTGFNRGWKIPTPFQEVLLSIPYFYRYFLSKIRYPEDFYLQEKVYVESGSFCFFFLSINDISEIDYFDCNVFLYYEENIIARKLHPRKFLLLTNVEVFHNHSKTIDKNLNRIKKYKTLSKSRRYFEKNYNHANYIILFLLWFLESLIIFGLSILNYIKIFFSSKQK